MEGMLDNIYAPVVMVLAHFLYIVMLQKVEETVVNTLEVLQDVLQVVVLNGELGADGEAVSLVQKKVVLLQVKVVALIIPLYFLAKDEGHIAEGDKDEMWC